VSFYNCFLTNEILHLCFAFVLLPFCPYNHNLAIGHLQLSSYNEARTQYALFFTHFHFHSINNCALTIELLQLCSYYCALLKLCYTILLLDLQCYRSTLIIALSHLSSHNCALITLLLKLCFSNCALIVKLF
jgi:hypothetical protein